MQLEARDEAHAKSLALKKIKTGKYKFIGPECWIIGTELIKTEETENQEVKQNEQESK